jgi:hypothetical protein
VPKTLEIAFLPLSAMAEYDKEKGKAGADGEDPEKDD